MSNKSPGGTDTAGAGGTLRAIGVEERNPWGQSPCCRKGRGFSAPQTLFKKMRWTRSLSSACRSSAVILGGQGKGWEGGLGCPCQILHRDLSKLGPQQEIPMSHFRRATRKWLCLLFTAVFLATRRMPGLNRCSISIC